MSKSTTTMLTALLANAERTNTLLEALVTNLSDTRPAVTTEAAPEAKKESRVSKTKKSERKLALVSDKPVRHLVKKNRADFVKAHPWAAGLSTGAIAEAVVTGKQSCVEGWAIGERRTAMVLGTPKPVQAVVVKAAPSEPAKPSTGALAERRADGTITPKSEWEIRKSLRLSGLDRREVDMAMESLHI